MQAERFLDKVSFGEVLYRIKKYKYCRNSKKLNIFFIIFYLIPSNKFILFCIIWFIFLII